MTNFEKYKDEILKIIETGCCCIAVKNGKPVKCESMPGCDNCELNTDGESGCAFEFLKWAYEDDGEIKKSMKGCAECAHASKTIHEYPCSECGRSYPDKFELKPKKTRQSEFLKPCPFCGGKAKVRSEDRKKGKAYWAYCAEPIETGCDVRPVTCRFDTLKKAVEAWNRRAQEVK